MLIKAAGRFVAFTYVILTCIFLATSLMPLLNPASWWFVGFAGLLYPYIFILLLAFTFVLIPGRPKLAIAGIVALILSFPNLRKVMAFNTPSEFRSVKADRHIRVMTWNVRRFTPWDKDFFDPRKNNLGDIVEEVRLFNPDILCFQEFYTGSAVRRRNLELFRDSLGYRYVAYDGTKEPNERSNSGAIIFSRYPIVRAYTYRLPQGISTAAESPAGADIVIGRDTLRVVNFHMQSYGFLNRDYQDLYKIRNQDEGGLQASWNIFHKMRYAFSKRGQQADLIRNEIGRSPYPVVACGDMNDVPNSYAYETVRKDLKDAFLEKGTGLGKSFISGRSRFLTWLPTLRIDYIFTDPAIRVSQFRMVTRKLSDHRGLITDLELPEN